MGALGAREWINICIFALLSNRVDFGLFLFHKCSNFTWFFFLLLNFPILLPILSRDKTPVPRRAGVAAAAEKVCGGGRSVENICSRSKIMSLIWINVAKSAIPLQNSNIFLGYTHFICLWMETKKKITFQKFSFFCKMIFLKCPFLRVKLLWSWP